MPDGIQRKRTKGWRKPPNTICVTRPSRWGNPYATAEEYEHYLQQMAPEERAALLAPLRGQHLACFCPLTKPCHRDVLLRWANQ